jgi:hypothetical protein
MFNVVDGSGNSIPANVTVSLLTAVPAGTEINYPVIDATLLHAPGGISVGVDLAEVNAIEPLVNDSAYDFELSFADSTGVELSVQDVSRSFVGSYTSDIAKTTGGHRRS